MHAPRRFPALPAAVALIGLASCDRPPPAQQDAYLAWRDAGPRAEVEAYRQFLIAHGVGDVMPMSSLLRSSRRWRQCRHAAFALPPRALWPNILPTLRLVKRLREEGLIQPGLARSGYRDAAVNRCADGATRSKHLRNLALDFDLPPSADGVRRLCAFWRTQGRDTRMGLGFYSPTTIHVDADGYRTWGNDRSWRTSLCRAPIRTEKGNHTDALTPSV